MPLAGINLSARGPMFEPNPQTPLQRGTSPLDTWYSGIVNQTAYTVGAMSVDNLRAYFITIGRGAFVDRLAFEVTTVGGAGSVGRCGIYNCSQTRPTNYPTSLILDGGEFACDAGTTKIFTPPTPVFLPAGHYWFASLFGVAGPTVRQPVGNNLSPGNGITSAMGNTPVRMIQVAFPYAALPSSFPAGATQQTVNPGAVHVRLSS